MDEVDTKIEEHLQALSKIGYTSGTQQESEARAGALSSLVSYKLSLALGDLKKGLDALRGQWKESSDQQSKHTRALVWWSGVLAVVTLMYAVIAAMSLWHDCGP